METRDSEDLEKPQEKSVSGSRAVDEPASVRPEVLSKARMPHADQKAQDKASHTKPVQRNSIFNRAMRLRSRGKARDASEGNAGHPAGQYRAWRSQLLVNIQLESVELKDPY